MNYWTFIFAAVLALPMAYVIQFSSATLAMGRALSDSIHGKGFQDAITPPWQTKMGMVVYGVAILVFVGIWVDIGFLHAIAYFVALFIASAVTSNVMPKHDSDHFKGLIVASMRRRAAEFSREGRDAEWKAMAVLLGRVEASEKSRAGLADVPGIEESATTQRAQSSLREAEEVLAGLSGTLDQLQALDQEELEWVEWHMSLSEEQKRLVEDQAKRGVEVTPENFEQFWASVPSINPQ